jgi:hypothetical protein
MPAVRPQSPADLTRRGVARVASLAFVLVVVCATVVAIVHAGRSDDAPGMTSGVIAAAADLRPVDGGPQFYARFPASLPSTASYFPVGVWFESVLTQEEVDADRRAGINLYIALTGNSDLRLIARNGMKVLAQPEDWLGRAKAPGSQAIAGWLLADEVDMQLPPRKGLAKLRRISRRLPRDGRLRYVNFGKGVTFWNTRVEAARYVNRFQDVVSADNYWFTDRNICGASEGGVLLGAGERGLSRARCHRAANYGRTVERVRELVRPAGSRPVWAFVEVGHPFSDAHWPTIRPAEVSAAVWSSIIHGARGIVYFNHSFGGRAPTQHALRERAYAGVRRAVARTNARIHRLAPVLNAPFADGFAATGANVETMTKAFEDRYYVFAGSRGRPVRRATFRVPCTGPSTVTVVDEGRTLALADGAFADAFADGNAVHIYRIDDATSCRPPST